MTRRLSIIIEWLKHRPLALGSLGLAATLLTLSFFGEQGLWRIFFLRKESSHMQERVIALRKENLDLRRQWAKTRLDPLTIERLAREQLGLGRAYDRVYIIK